MTYTELPELAECFRQEYVNSVEKLIQKKYEEASAERKKFAKSIKGHEDEYRMKLVHQLGWPLTEYFSEGDRKKEIPKVKKHFVIKEADYHIYRLQIEIFPEFWYYGLFFVKEDGKKRPLVISQHGGQGTPELCSTIYEEGSSNYNDMTRRIMEYDVNVFVPQMLLWEMPKYGAAYDRHLIDNQLKRLGGCITALELFCLMRSIDYLSGLSENDIHKMGMVGLSYGGMFTLHMAALDVRLKTAVSCSYFCDRFYENWNDWTYYGSAYHFLDAETAMLVHPRKIHLAMGDTDQLFSAEKSQQEFEKVSDAYEDELSWIDLTIFEGEHEFMKENDLIDKMMIEIRET